MWPAYSELVVALCPSGTATDSSEVTSEWYPMHGVDLRYSL